MSGRQHILVVDGVNGSWQRTIVLENFQHRARRIYDLAQTDVDQGQTRLTVPPALTPETLRRLVLWIDRRIPYRQVLNFRELLQLSTAIWQYQCDPGYFRNLAASNYEHNLDTINVGREAAGCAFIALTFNWRGDFEDASRQLIFGFESNVNFIEGVPYFPGALRDAVVSARRSLLRRTFEFIKSDVVRYARAADAFAHINHCLYSKGIDITMLDTEYVRAAVADVDDSEGEIGCVRSPGRMLDIFESILLDEPQVGQPLQTPPFHEPLAESSTSSSGNGTISGRQTKRSSTSGFLEERRVATLRGDSAVAGGSLRRFAAGYFARKRQSVGDDRGRPPPRWEQGAVDQFRAVAAQLRGRVEARRLELFGGCGLNIVEFHTLRRERLLITQAATG